MRTETGHQAQGSGKAAYRSLGNGIASGVAAAVATAAAVGLSPMIPVLAIAAGFAGFHLTNEHPKV